MTPKSIQDFLPLVERPSRYLGSEINTIRKELSPTGLRFALAFPDLYEIGTSHFGIQILYQVLNNHPHIAAERVFAPAEDVEALLRSCGVPLTSLETHTPLKNFDIIGFSLLYELNYTNILTILDLAGIPFLAQDRERTFPLVVGGGPCACNPEPLADYFDAFVVGDGEEVALEMAKTWLACRQAGAVDKAAVLDAWSSITGVYIPAMFPVRYSSSGFQETHPPLDAANQHPRKVTRAVLADLDKAVFPRAPILPYGKPVHDRLRLEVSRGCTRGCRFCQAGMIYRPVRERSEATLMNVCRASLDQTGYEDISLLSLSTGDYSCIASLMAGLMASFESSHTAVSLPSLRAGTLTPELMALVKRVRKTGFTIAPEAGSQRLRNVINKNSAHDEIIETVKKAFGLGWQVIKLYFMIGLPTETDEDLQGIIDLVEELRKIKGNRGRPGKINVSVTTFIPKPHTPFQWHSVSTSEFRRRQELLRHASRSLRGVRFNFTDVRLSAMEDFVGRGDRRLAPVIEAAWRAGAGMDAWFEALDRTYAAWTEAIAAAGLEGRYRDLELGGWSAAAALDRDDLERFCLQPLPWDHIDTGLAKTWLAEDLQRALAAAVVPDCSFEGCSSCGVCGPDLGHNVVVPPPQVPEQRPTLPPPSARVCRLRFGFSKTGAMALLSHLDLVRMLERSLRRSGVPVSYTGGFHPLPRLQIALALPLGVEAYGEWLDLEFLEMVDPAVVMEAWQRTLPPGFQLRSVEAVPVSEPSLSQRLASAEWRFRLRPVSGETLTPERWDGAIAAVLAREALVWQDTDKKGRPRQRDCRPSLLALRRLEAEPAGAMPFALEAAIDAQGRSLRPGQLQHWLAEALTLELSVHSLERTALRLHPAATPVLG